jgi:hypothetical protein
MIDLGDADRPTLCGVCTRLKEVKILYDGVKPIQHSMYFRCIQYTNDGAQRGWWREFSCGDTRNRISTYPA